MLENPLFPAPIQTYRVLPSSLAGKVTLPSSKSHTLRSLVFAALSHESSSIIDPLPSPDTDAMISALALLGVPIQKEPGRLSVKGLGGIFKQAEDVIDCGNSGQVLRFIGALSGLMPHYTILTGDASIRSRRPALPLLSALEQLGAFATSSRGNGLAPLIIKGPWTHQKARLCGADSQPVSGLLIAAAFHSQPTQFFVDNPGETPWIDLTLSWLDRFNIPYARNGYTFYEIQGNATMQGFSYQVPGDLSTAAFPTAAALITRSDLTIDNIDLTDVQGDKQIFPILEAMGACFLYDSKKKQLQVFGSRSTLAGGCIDINPCIDALPILSVLGCFCTHPLTLVNGRIARQKESDRIYAICKELKKMGASIEEQEDGLTVCPSSLKGTLLETHADHRIALSLSMAALGADGPSVLEGMECTRKTYSSFLADFQNLGAQIEDISYPLRV